MSFPNERRNFRVSFVVPLQGKARIISINSAKFKLDKYFHISVLDLSASGLKINCLLDLPVGENIVLETTLTFGNKIFILQGILIWKEEKCNQKIYGTKFICLTEMEERRLIYSLNKYLLNRTKLERSRPGETPSTRIINTIPYPAILITPERKILAANNLSKKIGIIPETKCYQGFRKENKICSFCLLEEAQKRKGIIVHSIYIKNKKYLLHWLRLEKKIFLHYWRKM